MRLYVTHLQCLTYTNVCSDGDDFDKDVSFFPECKNGQILFSNFIKYNIQAENIPDVQLNELPQTEHQSTHHSDQETYYYQQPLYQKYTLQYRLLVHAVCTAKQFSTGTLCQFILPSAEYELSFFHIFTNAWHFQSLEFICSGGCVVVSYCDFNFMFIITIIIK